MSKKERQVLIAIGVILILWYYFKDTNLIMPSSNTTDDGADIGAGDQFGGGSGSGYIPSGDDDTDSLGYDPYSDVQTSVPNHGGYTPPVVGDVDSGVSGKPAVGKPYKPIRPLGRPFGGPSVVQVRGNNSQTVRPISVLR
mgnify:CR=1 FL=1